jgi:hypothetical protein
MLEVALSPGPEGRRFACLRELCGRDELELGEREPAFVSDLLARLLVDAPGAALAPGRIGDASVGDRDRLVAALYDRCFGDRVECQTRCEACEQAFEVGFSLGEVLDDLAREAGDALAEAPAVGPDAEGFYHLEGGISFRLPTVADERALVTLDPDHRSRTLLARCVRVDGGEPAPDHADTVERAMAARDPVLSLSIPVPCAHCRADQAIDFDVVAFFVAALARERPLLTREIHAIASAYRWSFQEIAGLSRQQRHAHVELIALEREVAAAT